MMAMMMAWMSAGGAAPMMGMMGAGTYGVGGFFVGMTLFVALWGLLTGGAVLAAAWRVRVAPDTATAWGVVAIVAGALSLLAMGGWLLGSLAALAGGIMAVMAAAREPAAFAARRA